MARVPTSTTDAASRACTLRFDDDLGRARSISPVSVGRSCGAWPTGRTWTAAVGPRVQDAVPGS